MKKEKSSKRNISTDFHQVEVNQLANAYDTSTEQALLGSVLMDNNCLSRVKPWIPTEDVFYAKINQKIDKKIYGVKGDELVGSIRHHYSYYETLCKTKINIECPQYQGWGFHTQRMMESLANGCCYFYPTPPYNIDFPNGLIDKEDYVIYHSPDDLIEKIDYYLSNEKEMKSIAENGFNKLIKYHTSEVRAKEFIETCERYMNEN